MTRLSLALLGEFDALLDGRRLTGFETVKVRALLAYLVVEVGRPHQRELLAGMLWPDVPGEAARTYLRQVLANLRAVLSDRSADPAFLVITREAIQFNTSSDHWLDITAFGALLDTCARHAHRQPALCARCALRLEEAAALYRGPLLDQFCLGDSTAFEEWAALKREALHQQGLSVLTRLGHYHERRGAYDDVRRVAWRQLELDPWREEAHQQLMRALWHSGERSAALAQYERCRETLQAELGVEPAAETTALYNDIRTAAFKAQAMAPDDHRTVSPLHSLPSDTTPFIGRDVELGRLNDLLATPGCQLLTLVGPGGIGKTRVAIQLAREQCAAFAHGAAFVPLAAVSTAALIVPAVAQALQMTLHSREDPWVQLVTYLRNKELLLILDNFEQLQAGSGVLVDLIQQALGVTLLITSRERLHLQEEWAVQIEGLEYPADNRTDTLEQYSGTRLFLESARRVQGGRALDGHERQSVARICRLVGGIPLAIELAAAWVRLLSCAEIAMETERALSFLTSPSQGGPERHRSMQAVFERSWQLLSRDEQRVLRQLAVFRGGCEHQAVAAVAGTTVPLLAALVDKSLVRRGADGRYRMHELVRQYAEEQLVSAGEIELTRERHLCFYLGFAEEMEQKLFGAEQDARLVMLEAEHDNLRGALQWALECRKTEQGLRLSGVLWWFWWVRGHVSEGREWLTAALALSGAVPMQVQAKALHGAGWLAVQQGDYGQATALLDQGLALAKATKDMERVVAMIHDLAQAARLQGDHQRAIMLYEQSATLGYELADRRLIGRSIGGLGAVAHAEGDNVRAGNFLEASLTLLGEAGDKVYMAWMLSFAGRVAKDRGDYTQAAVRLVETLTLFRDIEDKDGIAFALEGFAGLAAAQGSGARATRLFGAAAALREAITSPMAPFDQPEYDRDMAAARAQLDEAMFATAWAAGRVMTLEQAIAYALAEVQDG